MAIGICIKHGEVDIVPSFVLGRVVQRCALCTLERYVNGTIDAIFEGDDDNETLSTLKKLGEEMGR